MQVFTKMSDGSKVFTIERLNKKNVTWNFEVEMWLRREDLWQYIEEKPSVQHSKWKKGDEKALATVVVLVAMRNKTKQLTQMVANSVEGG